MTRRDFVCATSNFDVRARREDCAPDRALSPRHGFRAKCGTRAVPLLLVNRVARGRPDFARGGIQLQTTDAAGEIRRTAATAPNIIGLERGVINMVFTDHIPMKSDNACALPG